MILICGIPSESPLRMVLARLEAMNADFVLFNQRDSARSDLWFALENGAVRGEFVIAGCTCSLEALTAVYPRLMDDRLLPELADEPPGSPSRAACCMKP